MLRSMTGFGTGRGEHDGQTYVVEVKSLNSRHLDLRVHLPQRHGLLEPRVHAAVRRRLARGRVEVTVREVRSGGRPPGRLLDAASARELVDELRALKEDLSLPGDVDVAALGAMRDALLIPDANGEPDAAWPGIAAALLRALDELVAMRETEGEALLADLQAHVARVVDHAQAIRDAAPLAVTAVRDRLHARLQELLVGAGGAGGVGGAAPDPWRLAQEVAYLAERGDFSEEVARLAIHVDQFVTALGGRSEEGTDPLGRRLDFLLQEMMREANTIGAKASDARISQHVVELKSEMERLREQVQNVE